MNWAVETLSTRPQITVEGLLEVHERLLAGTRREEHGGRIREVQNWIGGSDYDPCSAAFVPPPHEQVPGLLEDLCEFCNSVILRRRGVRAPRRRVAGRLAHPPRQRAQELGDDVLLNAIPGAPSFTALERQLASPHSDTRTAPPTQRVPGRRATTSPIAAASARSLSPGATGDISTS
ncbi:MAG TPA: hypothetical protein VK631_29215 [Solirubrobacteraceae bacterium]|nr:hypothetical protein [Solirubrobacteraceae bacterium]